MMLRVRHQHKNAYVKTAARALTSHEEAPPVSGDLGEAIVPLLPTEWPSAEAASPDAMTDGPCPASSLSYGPAFLGSCCTVSSAVPA